MPTRKFLGNCMGVEITHRGPGDGHACFKILVEDDGNWLEKAHMSSFWLDELVEMLHMAHHYMEENLEPDAYGYKFREEVR